MGDLMLEAYVALGGTFDHLQDPPQQALPPVQMAINKVINANLELQKALEWETIRQQAWEECQAGIKEDDDDVQSVSR